jgi:hypothetical protein
MYLGTQRIVCITWQRSPPGVLRLTCSSDGAQYHNNQLLKPQKGYVNTAVLSKGESEGLDGCCR